MRTDADDVMALPTWERRFVAVVNGERAEKTRDAPSGSESSKGESASLTKGVARAVVAAGPTSVPGVIGAGAAILLAGAADLARSKNAPSGSEQTSEILYLTNTQAAKLRFPPGHPSKNVVYVLNPVNDGLYYPFSEFHRFVFDAKVAEALDLLVALGAATIEIEHEKGFAIERSVAASVPIPGSGGVEVGGAARGSNKSGSKAHYTMKLSPTAPPHLPEGLKWYEHEASWKSVATARLNGPLDEFDMDLSYTQSFGVNAELKAMIAGLGLSVGGDFTECEETRWHMKGTFARI